MSDLFLRVYKHLTPRSRAWSLVADRALRRFFEGLTGLPSDIQDFIDQIWLDIFPGSTRQVSEWESQFGIISPPLAEGDRRDGLAASWARGGGQGPDTLQDALTAAGFPLFVHEPWFFVAGVKNIYDPRAYLFDGNNPLVYAAECGEPLAECGEPLAECGETVGPSGILLVNKIIERAIAYTTAVSCGEAGAECGEIAAECGDNTGFTNDPKPYIIPGDPNTWPYFWYVGGENFGDMVPVSLDRKDELETLILKIGPAHLWAGLFATYSE